MKYYSVTTGRWKSIAQLHHSSMSIQYKTILVGLLKQKYISKIINIPSNRETKTIVKLLLVFEFQFFTENRLKSEAGKGGSSKNNKIN